MTRFQRYSSRFCFPIKPLSVALLLVSLCGCQSLSKDPKTPEGAVNVFLKALKKQNYEKIYSMLSPGIHADVDAIYSNTKAMVKQINSHYPATLKAAALKEINASSLNGSSDARSFFIQLMKSKKLSKLSKWAFYGAQIKKSTDKGKTAVVSTMKGDEFQLVKAEDGKWRLAFNAKAFTEARIQTEENLKKIKKNIALLKRLNTIKY